MIPRRQFVLGVVLAATLGATWWAANLEEEAPEAPSGGGVMNSQAPRPSRSVAVRAPSLASLDAPRAPLGEPPALFQPRSFEPPPPPPPPPPKPQAPPLPFRFIGALEEGGERAVFLLEGTQVHMVRAGEQVGSQYRVERITPTAIEFIYLPLKQPQILATARP